VVPPNTESPLNAEIVKQNQRNQHMSDISDQQHHQIQFIHERKDLLLPFYEHIQKSLLETVLAAKFITAKVSAEQLLGPLLAGKKKNVSVTPKAERISQTGSTSSEAEAIVELAARKLTLRYLVQIMHLTSEDDTLPVLVLANTAVEYMIDYLGTREVKKLSMEDLTNEMVNCVFQANYEEVSNPVPPKELATASGNVVDIPAEIQPSDPNAKFNAAGVFSRSGIVTKDGKLFVARSEVLPSSYGVAVPVVVTQEAKEDDEALLPFDNAVPVVLQEEKQAYLVDSGIQKEEEKKKEEGKERSSIFTRLSNFFKKKEPVKYWGACDQSKEYGFRFGTEEEAEKLELMELEHENTEALVDFWDNVMKPELSETTPNTKLQQEIYQLQARLRELVAVDAAQ
jgi:hypothetical protein